MMGMIHRPVLRQLLAVRTIKRVNVIAARAGVLPVIRFDSRQYFAGVVGLVIVAQDRFPGLAQFELPGGLVPPRPHEQRDVTRLRLHDELAPARRARRHQPPERADR
jgi:hypothetical protein